METEARDTDADRWGLLDLTAEQNGEARAGRPGVELVNRVLLHAIRRAASDVHLEWFRSGARLRWRIDGVLHVVPESPDRETARSAVGRIKALARLDVAEHRLPQDGRLRVRSGDGAGERSVDLRVAVLPGPFGENVALRLLNAERARALEDLGMAPEDRAGLLRCLERGEGMILLTGPSGSGKTTTLYAGLRALVTTELKAMTVEDPIEYEIPGVVQHQVTPQLGFADYARAFLRQDPDVVVIGEIRDAETVSLALRAAMTGHLVLSTLHTHDAVAAVRRLRDLGGFLEDVTDVLQVVVGQRLVRRVCAECGGPKEGSSCTACQGVGYAGRAGVFETILLDDGLRGLFRADDGGVRVRERLAHAGRTLADDAWAKVHAGVTTAEEIRRCVPGIGDPPPRGTDPVPAPGSLAGGGRV